MKSIEANYHRPRNYRPCALYVVILVAHFVLSCDREGPAAKAQTKDDGRLHLRLVSPKVYRLENFNGTEFVDVWTNDGKINLVGYTNHSIDSTEFGFSVALDFSTQKVTDITILDTLFYSYTVKNGDIARDREVVTREENRALLMRDIRKVFK